METTVCQGNFIERNLQGKKQFSFTDKSFQLGMLKGQFIN